MSVKKICVYLILTFSIAYHTSCNAETYDDVVSLGYGCQVAWQLQIHGYRKQAYPFDWLRTSFESLFSFIYNKGANFLDLDKINVLGPYLGDPVYLQVVDMVYGIQSFHDFESRNPLGNYQDVKSKYDRRVKRFFQLLATKKKILFVREGLTRAQVEQLDFLIHQLYPSLNYTILAVSENEEFRIPWGLNRISNFYLSQTTENWMGDPEQWKQILSHFSLSASFKQISQKDIW